MRRHKEFLASIATAMICFVAVAPALSISVSASGIADGTLDTTFDSDGKVITDIGRGDQDYGRSIGIQSDGKVIVGGESNISGQVDFSVVRYNTNGTLDTTFGTNGTVTTDFNNDEDSLLLITEQVNGKILAAGYSGAWGERRFVLARYNSNGTLDTTFDGDGKVIAATTTSDTVGSIALQPDGKIIAAGYRSVNNELDISVLRYNQDGTLDTTFDTDGIVTTNISTYDEAHSVALQPDGKIIVVGTSPIADQGDFTVLRYNTNGSLDTTFDGETGNNGNGIVTTDVGNNLDYDEAKSVTVQTDGKIIVAGRIYLGGPNDFAIARYNSDGSLDTTFSTDGKTTTDMDLNDYAESVAVQSDGKIVAAGWTNVKDFAVVRYNTNGTLDTTFDTDGKLTTVVSNEEARLDAIAMQPNGQIVIVGYGGFDGSDDFAVARYNVNGTLDTTFDTDGLVTTNIGTRSSTDEAFNIAVQPDGKTIVVGYNRTGNRDDFAVTRYNTNGSLDTTFDGDGKVTTNVVANRSAWASSVAIQADGKIIVVGTTDQGGFNDFAIVRYNANGTLDNTFDTDGKVTTDIGADHDDATSVAIQADGKIIAAGYSVINNYRDFAAVRYNTNGTLDNTFGTGGKVTTSTGDDDRAESVAIQADGKIVLAGYSWITDHNDVVVVRYNANGTLDNTFGTNGKVSTVTASSESFSIALQSDGKIIVAGVSYGGNYVSSVVSLVMRYNANGTLDNTFGTNGKVTSSFENNETEGYAVALEADGKIVVAGNVNINNIWGFGVMRFNTNGTLDTTFDTDGKASTSLGSYAYVKSLALQADGKIVITGTSDNDFAVVRYYSAPPAGYVAPTTPSTTPSTTTSTTTTTTAAPSRTTTQSAPALSAITGLPLATRPLVAGNALTPGQFLRVSYEGFKPGELVQLVVASTPQVIGSGYANASGFVTLTGALPRNLGAGKHTLAVYAPVSKKGFRQPITVTTSQLPSTGAANPSDTLLTAMYLFTLGAGLVATRRGLVA
jgi:uncharacterized delta-60 repeat protein